MFQSLSEMRENTYILLLKCEGYAKKNDKNAMAQMFSQLAEKNEHELYQIAVMGFLKRGKSTLLNVLLGQENTVIAPVKSTVCTAAITKYLDLSLSTKGEKHALIHFLNGETREIPYDKISSYVNEKENRDNCKDVKCIHVYGDFPLIRSSVAIVDTPGRGSVHNAHDVMVDEFLPFADAIILTQAADLPMEAEERRFLSQLPEREKRCVFVVLTKVDTLDEKDLQVSENFIRNQLQEIGIPCGTLYRTAAKQVLDARKKHRKEGLSENPEAKKNEEDLSKKWGIAELERALEKEITTHSDKTALLLGRIKKAVEQMLDFLEGEKFHLQEGLQSLQTEDIPELQKKREEIKKKKESVLRENRNMESKFMKEWKKAIRRAITALESKKGRVEDDLSREIDQKGLLELLSHSSKFSRKIREAIFTQCEDVMRDLEDALQDLSEKYFDEFDEVLGLSTRSPKSALFSGGVIASLGFSGTAMAAGSGAVLMTATSVVSQWGAAIVAASKTSFLSSALGTTAAANAASALSSAIFATALGAVVCGGVGVSVLVVNKIARVAARKSQMGEVMKIVREEFDAFANSLQSQLELTSQQVLDAASARMQEELEGLENQMLHIEEAIAANDGTLQKRMEENLSHVEAMIREGTDIFNRFELYCKDVDGWNE